eukprot:7653211-Karenia_brevis.AAC.1
MRRVIRDVDGVWWNYRPERGFAVWNADGPVLHYDESGAFLYVSSSLPTPEPTPVHIMRFTFSESWCITASSTTASINIPGPSSTETH